MADNCEAGDGEVRPTGETKETGLRCKLPYFDTKWFDDIGIIVRSSESSGNANDNKINKKQ